MIVCGATVFSSRALLAATKEGIYGLRGPTNWDAVLVQVANGHWGYLLFPAMVWMDAVDDFYSVMMGTLMPEAAVRRARERAADILWSR